MSRTPAPASYMGIPVHRLPKLAEFKAGAPRQNRMLSELGGSSNTLVAPLTTAFRVLDLTAANTQSGYSRYNADNPSFNTASGLTHMKTRSTASKEGITGGGFGAVPFHHLLYANGTNRPHRGIVLRGALNGDTLAHLRATETKILYELKRKQQSLLSSSSNKGEGEKGDVESVISELTNTSWRSLLSISHSQQHPTHQPQKAVVDTHGVLDGSSSLTAVPNGHGLLFKSKGSSTTSTPAERVTQKMEDLIPRLGFEVGHRESIEWLGGVLNPHRLEKSKSNDVSFYGKADSSTSSSMPSPTTSGGGRGHDIGLAGKDATLQAGYFPASAGLAPPANLLKSPSVIREPSTEEGDSSTATQSGGEEGAKDGDNKNNTSSSSSTSPLFDAPSDVAYGVSEPWRMGTSIEPHRRVVVEDEFVSYYSDTILLTSSSSSANTTVSYTRAMEGMLKRGKKGSGGENSNNTRLPVSWNIIKRPYFQHSLKETMLVPTTRLLLRFHIPVAIADMCISQNDQKAISQVKQGHRAPAAVYANHKGTNDNDGGVPNASFTSSSVLLPTASVDRLVSDARAIYGEATSLSDNTTAHRDGEEKQQFYTMHQRMSQSVDNFGTDRPVHEVRVGPGDIVFVPRGWKYELLRELGRSATDLLAMARRGGSGDGDEAESKGKRGAVQLLVADSIVKDNGAMPGGRRKHTHTSLLVNTNALKAAAASPPSSPDGTSDSASTTTTDYVPEYKRRVDGWGGKVATPTPTPTPNNTKTEEERTTTTTPHYLEEEVVELDSDPSRLLSCDCFKVSFRPFPVLTEKQREIYLSSDYGTSVLDFYDKGGNDPLKHFVH